MHWNALQGLLKRLLKPFSVCSKTNGYGRPSWLPLQKGQINQRNHRENSSYDTLFPYGGPRKLELFTVFVFTIGAINQ